jgi:hypothetical protein
MPDRLQELHEKKWVESIREKVSTRIAERRSSRLRRELLETVEDESESHMSRGIKPLRSVNSEIYAMAQKQYDKDEINYERHEAIRLKDWDRVVVRDLNYFMATTDGETGTQRTEVLERVVRNMDPDEQINCRVVIMRKGENPNAFVVADGTIFVSQSLLNMCDTEDDIAFVLGHEMGHIKRRSSVQIIVQNAFNSWGVKWIHEAIAGDQESINFMERGGYKVTAAPKMLERLAGFERDREHQSGVMRATQTFGNFAVVNRTSGSAAERPLHPSLKGSFRKTNMEIYEKLSEVKTELISAKDSRVFAAKLHPQDLQQVFEDRENIKRRSRKVEGLPAFRIAIDKEIVSRTVALGHSETAAQIFVYLQKKQLFSSIPEDLYFMERPEKFLGVCAELRTFHHTPLVNEIHKSVFLTDDPIFVRLEADDFGNSWDYSAVEHFFGGGVTWLIYDREKEPSKTGMPVTRDKFVEGVSILRTYATGFKDQEYPDALAVRYMFSGVILPQLSEAGNFSTDAISDYLKQLRENGYYIDGKSFYYTVRNYLGTRKELEFNGHEIQINDAQRDAILKTIIEELGVVFEEKEKVEFTFADIDRLLKAFEFPPSGEYQDDKLGRDILLNMSNYLYENSVTEEDRILFIEYFLSKLQNFRYRLPYSFEEMIKTPYSRTQYDFKPNLKTLEGEAERLKSEQLYKFHIGLVMLVQFFEDDNGRFYEYIGRLCDSSGIDFNDLTKVQTINLVQEVLLAEQNWSGHKPMALGTKKQFQIDFSKSRLRMNDYSQISELPFIKRLLRKETVEIKTFAELYEYQKNMLQSISFFSIDRRPPEGINIFRDNLTYILIGQDVLDTATRLVQEGIPEVQYDELAKFMEESYPHNIEYKEFIAELDKKFLGLPEIDIRRKIDHLHDNIERIGYEGLTIVAEQITRIEDFRYFKTRMSDKIDDYLEGNETVSALALGDFGSQFVNGHFENVFLTAVKNPEVTVQTSTNLAAGWFSFIKNIERHTYHKVRYDHGLKKFFIDREASQSFISVRDSMMELEGLSGTSRSAIALKLLVDKNGGMSSPENRKKISNMVVSALRINNNFVRSSIVAACTEADAKLIALPVAQTMGPMLFRTFDRAAIDLSRVAEEPVEYDYRIDENDNSEKFVKTRVKDIFSAEEIRTITNSPTRDIRVFGPEFQEHPKSEIFALVQECDQKYYIFTDGVRQMLLKRRGPETAPLQEPGYELDPETESIIRAVEVSGPLGARSLQLTRQFENLSPALERRLSQSFDRNKGMDKLRFWINLDKLATEDEEVEAFVQRIELREYKGGGSLQTTFRADYHPEEGGTLDVVLRLKNPNVELFVDEVYESAYKTMQKVEREAKDKETKRHARMGMMLLNLSREWCKSDINDTDYERQDDIFRVKIRKFNDLVEGDLETFQYAPARVLTKKQLKVEITGLGETVNRVLETADINDDALRKRIVTTVSKFLLFQLKQSDYVDENGEEVFVVQSDPHIGNYLVEYAENGQFLGVLDRDFYLTLKRQDVEILNQFAEGGDPKKFLVDLVDRILEENKVSGLKKRIVKTNVLLKSGLQSLKDSADVMGIMRVVLTELEAAKINTPLSLRLMIRNIEAAKKLNQKYGMELKEQVL